MLAWFSPAAVSYGCECILGQAVIVTWYPLSSLGHIIRTNVEEESKSTMSCRYSIRGQPIISRISTDFPLHLLWFPARYWYILSCARLLCTLTGTKLLVTSTDRHWYFEVFLEYVPPYASPQAHNVIRCYLCLCAVGVQQYLSSIICPITIIIGGCTTCTDPSLLIFGWDIIHLVCPLRVSLQPCLLYQ